MYHAHPRATKCYFNKKIFIFAWVFSFPFTIKLFTWTNIWCSLCFWPQNKVNNLRSLSSYLHVNMLISPPLTLTRWLCVTWFLRSLLSLTEVEDRRGQDRRYTWHTVQRDPLEEESSPIFHVCKSRRQWAI